MGGESGSGRQQTGRPLRGMEMSANYDPHESERAPGPTPPDHGPWEASPPAQGSTTRTGWSRPGSVVTEPEAPSPASRPAASQEPARPVTEAPERSQRPAPARGPGAPSLVGARLRELVWLSVGVVDAFLALDFLFQAIAARGSGFVGVVTRVGNALASPFNGIFQNSAAPAVGHTTDWQALIAIVVYTAAAWVAVRLLLVVLSPARRPAPV